MNSLATVVLLGWPAVQLLLFGLMPSRRAVIVGLMVAWLFLPVYDFRIFLPEITKASVTAGSLLIGTILFDPARLASFRPRLVDMPMVIWCLCPFASSVTNDLGVNDGITLVGHQLFVWGIPYFVGRIHFRDWASARELAIGVFIGGLVYIPFCVFEMRMSPNLHHWVYGVAPFGTFDVFRFGGWRPSVFMANGLEVGMWMTATSLMGIWLWKTGSLRRLLGVPLALFVIALLATTGMCRSLGALSLLMLGIVAFCICGAIRSPKPMLLLVLAVILYISARATDPHGGEVLLQGAALIDQARADSLAVRMLNEDMLVEKALVHPTFGWGGWGRSRIFNEDGKDVSLTDSLWIIVIGMNGLVGLASVYTVLVTPLVLASWRFRWAFWRDPTSGPACALALVTALFTIDCLFNAMISPVYLVAAGAVVSIASARPIPGRPAPARSIPAPPPVQTRRTA